MDPLLDGLLGHVHGLDVALVSPSGRCTLARGRRLDGRAGADATELLHEPWLAPVLQALDRAERGEHASGEAVDPDGRTVVYTATAWPREPRAVLITLQDVTHEREQRRRLAAARGRFETAFHAAPVAMLVLGPDLLPVQTNPAALELTGASTGPAPTEPGRLFDYLDPHEVTGLMDGMRRLLRGERASLSVDHTLVRRDGRRLRVRTHARPVELDDGRMGALLTLVDISSELGLADELRRLSTDDPLTGVLNREGLEAALAAAVTRDGRRDAPMSLLLADVDDFARVNSILGTAEGDLVLREVADALRKTVRATDAVARTGGDEFALLLPGLDVEDAGRIAESVMERFSANLATRGGDAALLDLTLSVGVTGVTPGTSLDTALASAGIAVYAAQQAGRGRWMAGL